MISTLFALSIIGMLVTALGLLHKALTDEELNTNGRVDYFVAFVCCCIVVWLLAVGGRAYFDLARQQDTSVPKEAT